MFYKLIPTLFYKISMAENASKPPREVMPSSPLISAIRNVSGSGVAGAHVPAVFVSTHERMLEFLQKNLSFNSSEIGSVKEALLGIGRAAKKGDGSVLSTLAYVLEKMSPLGKEQVSQFIDQMWATSTGARDPLSLIAVLNTVTRVLSLCEKHQSGGEEISALVFSIMIDIKQISKKVTDKQCFLDVLNSSNHIQDPDFVSSYFEYLAELSREVKDEKNPSGKVSQFTVMRQAKEIEAEAEKGTEHAKDLIKRLYKKLEELKSSKPPA